MYGPIRTVAEGKGETILIGTTKNYILMGNLNGEFTPITQVNTESYLTDMIYLTHGPFFYLITLYR